MKIAALQYNAKSDIAHNCEIASRLIDKAAGEGARFICLPECANLLAKNKDQLFAEAQSETDSDFLARAQAKARHHNIWLSLGSLMIARADERDHRIANRHYIINPEGLITAKYDKIHMFDADVGDGKDYRETHSFRPGTEPVITPIDGWQAGLSICYDLRFASLYHHYNEAGAEMLLIPAAFTKVTGQAHWHVLQRSRAIENACFVIASAQTGTHDDGRQTYGHALIISPWGEVLADAGADGDMAIAEIDRTQLASARARLSAWRHQASFDKRKTGA